MPAYQSLTVQNFRSYAEKTVQFSDGVNIIIGPNGSGKTNLLEALYVLSTGSSFRTTDRDLVRHESEWFRLESSYDDQPRILTYRVKPAGGYEKQFTIDGAKKARLTHPLRVPVVLFEPDHLRLLRESPSHRRDFLDALLTKLQPDFSWLKHQFERVLQQRNGVLKRRLPPAQRDDQLFVWDIRFADLSEQLVLRRQALVQAIDARIDEVYSHIARKPHKVAMGYASAISGQTYKADLLALLQANVGHDSDRGFTTTGPHRDDFTLLLEAAPASTTASRGELRSLLLALKIIELQLLAETHETTPLLLLDDVFSELDAERRQALAQLATSYQTLITTTDADAVAGHFAKGYRVITTSS